MKSDINLNSKLVVGGNSIHSRRFKMIKRTALDACLTLASRGLHEPLIQFADKSRNR